MATSKSHNGAYIFSGHNSGTVKDTCKMFAPNWGFSGSGNQIVLFKFLLDPALLPWQQAGHKIGHYSVCMRDIVKILALYSGFSGSAN